MLKPGYVMVPRNNQTSKYFFRSGTLYGSPYEEMTLNVDQDDNLTIYTDEHHGDFKTPNPFHYVKVRTQRMEGTNYYLLPSLNIEIFSRGQTGVFVGAFDGLNDFDTSVYNDCLDKFNERLRGSIDLSIDLYQGRQTLALISKITKAVNYVKHFPENALRESFKAFAKVRHTNGGSIKRAVKEGGGLWLEYTYGLKPTLATLYDSAIELNRNIEPLMKIEVQSGRVTKAERMTGAGYLPSHKVTASSSTRYKISAKMKASSEVSNLLGHFTSLNPASFVWENTPYSFVVDWFYDVGGYLRNLETAYLYGNQFVGGYMTQTLKVLFEAKCHVHSSTVGGEINNWDVEGWTSVSAKRRTRVTGFPFPRPPSFSVDLSSGRMLNAAALLSQFLRK